VSCGGGGGGGSGGDNDNNPTGAETAFYSVFSEFDFNKPHENIIYTTGYDGLTSSEASTFINNLNTNGFDCINMGTPYNIRQCEKYNISQNIIYAGGHAEDTTGIFNFNYMVGEIIIGNSNLNNDAFDSIFPFVNKRQTDYSIDKCYLNDITTDEITPYINSLISQGFVLYGDGFYKKTVENFVYAFGYETKTASWNIARKEYANSSNWLFASACGQYGL
jgi:hypothetical protein